MSLQIIVAGRNQVVVASDSRGMQRGRPRDDFQKLFDAGSRSVCGIGGQMLMGHSEHDSASARVSRLCALDALRDRPQELLEAIRDEMLAPLCELFTWNSRGLRSRRHGSRFAFVAFCIKRAPAGEIDLLELQLRQSEIESKPVLEPGEIITHLEGALPRGPFVYSIGRAGAIDIENRVDPTLSNELVVRGVDDTYFETCKKLDGDEVGGPVDVAAIDSEGLRWLRKWPRRYLQAV